MFLSIIISCIQVLRNDTLPKAYRLVGNLYIMIVFSKDRAWYHYFKDGSFFSHIYYWLKLNGQGKVVFIRKAALIIQSA